MWGGTYENGKAYQRVPLQVGKGEEDTVQRNGIYMPVCDTYRKYSSVHACAGDKSSRDSAPGGSCH